MILGKSKMLATRWEVESLRVTTFYRAGDVPSDVARLWQLMTHRQPEQVSSRPAEGLHVAEGPFGGVTKRLQCAIRPDRVDWVLQAAPPPPDTPARGLVTAGSIEAVLPSFEELGIGWLGRSAAAVTRVAFGAIFVVRANDLREVCEILNAALPSLELDSENISEFLYRVNRQRVLDSPPGVQVNRISAWSIGRGGSLDVAVVGIAPPQFTHMTEFFSCRLELDMNTAVLFSIPIGGAEAAPLFKELVALGKEVVEGGDTI